MGQGIEKKNLVIRAVDALEWLDKRSKRVPEPIRAIPAALTRAVWRRTMSPFLRRMRGMR